MGIEPTYAAWKAAVLPLNYTRVRVFHSSFHLQSKSVTVLAAMVEKTW
jgi:hypothetical protein